MVDKILNRFVSVIQVILGFVILIMAAANVIQVVTRYFVSIQVTWVEDVSLLGLYWIFGLGTPMCWIIKQHLNMNAFEEKMSPKLKEVLWVVQNVIGLLAGAGLIKIGLRCIKINSGFVMSAIGFDESFRYYPLIVCGILMILVCALILIKCFKKGKEENLA